MIKAGNTTEGETCANCGAALGGEFCASCGQSSLDVKRNFIPLVSDTLDGLFQWDGRFFTTLRELFSRPGWVARDYMDGRRSRYSTPVRLYLIVSLFFFLAVALSGVRVIAINAVMTENGPGISMQMFQGGQPMAPIQMTQEEIDAFHADSEEAGISRLLSDMAIQAAHDPAGIEDRITSLASQAMILMVVMFAVLNLILHPRRKIIEHIVYALYFHAAVLPLLLVLIVGTAQFPDNFFETPEGDPRHLWLATSIGVASYLGFSAFVWAHDRGFYGSSWWGAALRSQALVFGYLFASVFLVIGLILIGVSF